MFTVSVILMGQISCIYVGETTGVSTAMIFVFKIRYLHFQGYRQNHNIWQEDFRG